jgi:hypothetical protein
MCLLAETLIAGALIDRHTVKPNRHKNTKTRMVAGYWIDAEGVRHYAP